MDSQKSVEVLSLVRIATLKNEVVKLDEEPLKLIDPETRHYPVAVVSVIGRTREQRGVVVKALIGSLYKESTNGSFALLANENEISEADAIFAVFPPGKITNEFGREIAVLILDISCSQDASSAYHKLANLCVLASSTVVYTASHDGDKMSNISTEISELESLEPSILSVNHLWIIIQDCDSCVRSKPNAPGLPTAKCEMLGSSESTKEQVLILAGYSDSSIRTLLANRSKDVEDHSPEGNSAECNLKWNETYHTILKVAIQIPGVTLGFLMPYFRQKWWPAGAQMELANPNHSCGSSSPETYANALSQPAFLGDRVKTCSSIEGGTEMGSFQNDQRPGVPIPPDSSTPIKSDAKEINSAEAEPTKVYSTNEISRNDYKEDITFPEQSGDDVSTESMTTLTGDLGQQKDTMPADDCVSKSGGADTGTTCIQTKLAALTLSRKSASELMKMGFEAEDCTEQEPEPMDVDPSHEIVSPSTGLMNDDTEKFFLPELPKIHTLVSENLQSASPSTMLDPHEMEAVDDNLCQRNTMQPKATYEEINEKPTSSSADSQGQTVRQAHICHPLVVKHALQYSLERYTEFIGAFAPPRNIYPVRDIKEVHEFACRHVLGAFPSHELSPTEELQGILWTSLQERLESNFAMMRKLDKIEEKLGRMCGMYYKDKMSRKMGVTTVSWEKAREIHQEVMHDTKKWFRQQCKDVLQPIKVYWEQVLDVKLEFWKTYYMDDFEVKQDLPHVTGFSLSAPNEQPTKSVSVGIYFGPDVVQFGLFASDMKTFNQKCVEILPFISFKDGKILIGDEARKCDTFKYNVFEVLSQPTDIAQRISVRLYSKTFSLTRNEFAVLFFHQAKKQFECLVNTQVGTCAVSASGLLPSASKQGLVSALRMSGFTFVRFIPSTTAILVWYIHWRQGQSLKCTQKDPRVLVFHHTGPLVEVVKADILAEQHLNVRTIGGFLNYNDFNEPRGGRVVQSAIGQALSEVMESTKDFEQIIVIQGSQSDPLVIQSFLDIICRTFHSAGHCEQQSRRHILFSAAAYDAHNNSDESVNTHWRHFPKFNHLFPHKLSIQIPSSKPAACKSTAMKFPYIGFQRHSFTLGKNESSFIVFESKNSKMLFVYPYSLDNSSSLKVVFDVTLRHDGTFNISGAPLKCDNFQFISDFGREYMVKQVSAVVGAKEQLMERSNSSCHTDTPEENVNEDLPDLMTTLRDQLKDVKQRLEVSRDLIKPMILEGIDDRIKACEKLLRQQDVKEKQLNVAMGQLKVAASRIPSKNQGSGTTV